MMDLAELTWGRWNSNAIAPVGSYVCFRTLAITQLTTDSNLPADGTWCRVDPSGTQTFANIATTINGVLSTTYTAGSFHAQGGGDIIANPGQATNDA